MTALLSAISGQFSRSLVLGTFFPTVFFVLLNSFLLKPFVPAEWPPLRALRALETGWETLAAAGLTVLLTGLLYNLNTPIIRFYEGYPWQYSLPGRWLVKRKRRRFREERAMWAGLLAVGIELRRANRNDERLSSLSDLADTLGRRVNRDFPSSESAVLPTRLGNVIRSFEDYPQRQYGMSAVTLWPRLAAVIDSGYASGIDDAKTSFDFMVNFSFLSGASSVLLLLLGLASPGALAGAWRPWLVEVLVLALAAYVFYHGSVSRAAAWGATVKSAFDLYRGKLLDQLGFGHHPGGMLEERTLWTAISQQMVFGDPPAHVRLPLRYREPALSARGRPASVRLGATKALAPARPGELRVMLRVRNPDPKTMASDVVVTDSVPEGHLYVWGSALVAGQEVPVTGANPYSFEVGRVPAGGEVLLEYAFAPVREPAGGGRR